MIDENVKLPEYLKPILMKKTYKVNVYQIKFQYEVLISEALEFDSLQHLVDYCVSLNKNKYKLRVVV